jgi:hypothetical protein
LKAANFALLNFIFFGANGKKKSIAEQGEQSGANQNRVNTSPCPSS